MSRHRTLCLTFSSALRASCALSSILSGICHPLVVVERCARCHVIPRCLLRNFHSRAQFEFHGVPRRAQSAPFLFARVSCPADDALESGGRRHDRARATHVAGAANVIASSFLAYSCLAWRLFSYSCPIAPLVPWRSHRHACLAVCEPTSCPRRTTTRWPSRRSRSRWKSQSILRPCSGVFAACCASELTRWVFRAVRRNEVFVLLGHNGAGKVCSNHSVFCG